MPTRSIFQPFLYKQAFMIAACLMILQKFSKPQCRVLFLPTRKDGVLYRFTFILVFHPFSYCFCHWTNAVLKPRPLKSLTKIACLHSFNQKKRPLTDEGGKNLRASGEKSPCYFLCPLQERFGQRELAFARLWQLEEAVMSAILGWTVQCVVRRHLSSFSS